MRNGISVKQPLALGDLARGTHSNKATAYRLLNAPRSQAKSPQGVAFLASDDAGYIMGQTLHVNGGMIFN